MVLGWMEKTPAHPDMTSALTSVTQTQSPVLGTRLAAQRLWSSAAEPDDRFAEAR
jgi:hypothetical protein